MYRGKILAIMDSATATTGYGDQAEVVLSNLVKRGWDVYQIACNCWDLEKQAKYGDDGYFYHEGIKLIPNIELAKDPTMIYPSRERIVELYNQIRPDIVFTLNDLYRVAGLTEVSPEFSDRWVHWFPVDTPNAHMEWAKFINNIQYLVMLSSFGYKDILQISDQNRFVDAVYHAVPAKTFRPLDKKATKSKRGLTDKFVITTGGRNQPRKRIYVTAEIVCKFLKSHPDAAWICKSDPNDPSMLEAPPETNLNHIPKKYGVQDRVQYETARLSHDELNEFYNCGDVFMHLSGGEGFGIMYVESMLAGVPCILNDNTTSPELTGGWKFGYKVPITGKVFEKRYNANYDVPDENAAYEALEDAYNSWKNGDGKLEQMGKDAREFHMKWCDEEKVVDKWEEIFQRIIRYNTKFVWHSQFGRGTGFSVLSEMLVPALEDLGYDAYVNDLCGGVSPIISDYSHSHYMKYVNNPSNIDFFKVPQIMCFLMEAFDYVKGETKIGWSFLESTKQREFCVGKCNSMDYIITSSELNNEFQLQSGVNKPIYIVPPSVDLARHPYIDRSLHRGNQPFTFLHIGVIQERKNTGQVIDGYCRAFEDNGKTKLIIKSGDFGKTDSIASAVSHRKDIEFIYTDDTPLTDAEMLKLYARADCYINISHGEGIGLPDLEAMATGLPVIGANWDTRREFLSDEVGWILPIAYMDQAYKVFAPHDCGVWAHYDGDTYIKYLQYAASHPEEAAEKGRRARKVAEKFTPEKAAKAIDDMLMDILTKKKNEKAHETFDEKYYTEIHKYTEDWHRARAIEIIECTQGLNGKVLDIGCGRGYLLKHFLEAGRDAIGVEISDYAVNHPMPGCEGRIFKGDASKLGYKDGEFDWGVAFSLLEHIPESQVDAVLQEMRRTCKRLLLEIAMEMYPEHGQYVRDQDPTHCTVYTPQWWFDKMAKNGLNVVWYDNAMTMIVESTPLVQPVTSTDRLLVGIPTKDRLLSLRRLFKSLTQQTFKNFDVLVVDDSIKDILPSDPELTAICGELWAQGISVGFFRGPGMNQAAAHNAIMENAITNGYKLVYRIDDDLDLEPDNIEALFNSMVSDVSCDYAAVGGIILNPYIPLELQKMPLDWRSKPEFAGLIKPCVSLAQNYTYSPDIVVRDDIQHLYSSYMYRPQLLKSVGGFPSNLSQVASREETIPLYELWLRGHKMKILTQVKAYHFHEQTGGCRAVPANKCLDLYNADEAKFAKKIYELQKLYGIIQ